MKEREYWLDYLRAFACILVTLGHLFMSFQESSIIKDSAFVTIAIRFVYTFHVYIFFFCSGYLFQKRKSPLPSMKTALGIRLEKCLNFLILYVLFSVVTYLVKVVFSSDVNSSVEHSFVAVVLQHPINQMWYMYAISIIFLFAHLMRSPSSAYGIVGIAALLRILICIPEISAVIPVPVNYLFKNMLWFALGQFFAYKQLRFHVLAALAFAVSFMGLFIMVCVFKWNSGFCEAALTLLGILASAGVVYSCTKGKTAISGIWKYISAYMLQIYLLHTIFAAGIRIVLMKLGVVHILPHLILGMVFSFGLPILCAVIAKRIPLLNIVFFPVETVKTLLKRSKKNHAA